MPLVFLLPFRLFLPLSFLFLCCTPTASSSLRLCPLIVRANHFVFLVMLWLFSACWAFALYPRSHLVAAKKLTDIFRYCQLDQSVLQQIASFDSVLFAVSVCSPALLLLCLCSLFCGQKCGVVCGAQPFDFDCFVLIEMFLQTAGSVAALPLRARPPGCRRQSNC